MQTETRTAIKHARSIEGTGTGEDREYAVACSCRTFYRSRLATYAAAVALDVEHKAAVADGTWQAEQDAEAQRLADLAPLHEAIRAHQDAVSARQSAGFEAIIARQRGGDVEGTRAAFQAAKDAESAAEAAVTALRSA